MPQSNIVEQLLEDIKLMQQNDVRVDVQPLKEQIESFNLKKRKAIDLMIDGLITKEDLKKQTEPSKNVKLVRLVQSQPFSWITET